jgi:hypothetical protein
VTKLVPGILGRPVSASTNSELQRGASASKIRFALWSAGIFTASLQSWAFRHILSPDAISYLDIAHECLHGNWHSLVNGYWSPLYPFLLSLALRLSHPPPYWESTVAHWANIGIFIFAFVSFEFLLRTLIIERRRSDSQGREAFPEWCFWALGDSIFICYTLLFNSLAEVHPDLLVSGFLYLAAGSLIRIRAKNGGWWAHVLLGTILGFSYLAKAVMFPVSFAFLGCCLFVVRPFRKSALQTILAFFCFAAVGSPLLVALSRAKGRLTFGDTGRISYAEFVDGAARYVNWQGGPGAVGLPVHATRRVFANPPVFEFAHPVGGTYPPWYDPSYWYEGIVPVFRLKNQLRALRYTVEEYAGILPYMGGLFVGFVALAIISGSQRILWRDLIREWPLWIPAAVALGLYALVYVEARLVGAFLVLAWISMFAGLRFPQSSDACRLVRSVTLGMVITLCVGIAWIAGRSAFRALAPKPFTDWEVAEGLRSDGIRSGSQVASVGNSLSAYWAHLAGVRIVAEIPTGAESQFWSSTPTVKRKIFTTFAEAGADAVVADQGPLNRNEAGWLKIGTTSYYVYLLHATSLRHVKRDGLGRDQSFARAHFLTSAGAPSDSRVGDSRDSRTRIGK